MQSPAKRYTRFVMSSSDQLTANKSSLSHDDIARRAEEIWRSYGCPQGRDEEIWLEAERQLSQKSDVKAPAEENVQKEAETTARPASTPRAENVATPSKRRRGAAAR